MTVSVKQIKILQSHHEMIKKIAQENKELVQDICTKAIEKFVVRRESHQGVYLEYLSSPSEGQYQSYWLDQDSIQYVKKISTIDNTSENRVLYTALFQYLQTHN